MLNWYSTVLKDAFQNTKILVIILFHNVSFYLWLKFIAQVGYHSNLSQGILVEGKGSVQLTSLYSLVQTSCIKYWRYNFSSVAKLGGQLYIVFPLCKESLLKQKWHSLLMTMSITVPSTTTILLCRYAACCSCLLSQ